MDFAGELRVLTMPQAPGPIADAAVGCSRRPKNLVRRPAPMILLTCQGIRHQSARLRHTEIGMAELMDALRRNMG